MPERPEVIEATANATPISMGKDPGPPRVLDITAGEIHVGDHLDEGRSVVQWHWVKDQGILITTAHASTALTPAGLKFYVYADPVSTHYDTSDPIRIIRGMPVP